MSGGRFTHMPFGPWPLGMGRLPRQSDLLETALADAVNVDVRTEGSVVTAPDWELVLPATKCSSLYYHGTDTYGVVDGEVSLLTETGVTPMLAVPSSVSWTDVAGQAYFATQDAVWRVVGTACEQVSGLGAADADDFDDALSPVPGGQWLSYWNGRLVVARGGSLVFSEPLRYGMYNPLTSYMHLGQWIEWVAALETGIYVGTADRVLWLEGTQPFDLRIRIVADKSAPGMAAVVPAETLGEGGAARYAVFFTRSGFTVGDASGTVKYPQASRFSDIPLHRGKLIVYRNRIFAVRSK